MKTDLGEIYVHIPFCVKKCGYCDFVSLACNEEVKDKYFESLHKQIELESESTGSMPVDSVFIGGGTPSIVKGGSIYDVLEHLRRCYRFEKSPEITIEMNPDSCAKEKLSIYKAAGINRVSIGLQSASDEELKALGRPHNYDDFLRAYDMVRNAGFENVNVDIMSALPGQTMKTYVSTLEKVISLKPEHISAYSLIIEEGTPFYERYASGIGLPDEDTEREMYYATREILGEAGYSRYEISNYAKPGFECRHNVGYWQRRPYVGFGIAAASFYNHTRYQMHTNLSAFIGGNFDEEKTVLSCEDEMAEYMFLGLRMMSGVSIRKFAGIFGKDIYEVYGKVIDKLIIERLMTKEGDCLRLTDYGVDVSNVCMAEFIL